VWQHWVDGHVGEMEGVALRPTSSHAGV